MSYMKDNTLTKQNNQSYSATFISWGGDTSFEFKWIDGPVVLAENETMHSSNCKEDKY